MRSGEGIVHGKFGIAYDPSDESIVFSGSGNESAAGLRANYERLEISGSWADPERYDEYATEFDLLWDKTKVTRTSQPFRCLRRSIKFNKVRIEGTAHRRTIHSNRAPACVDALAVRVGGALLSRWRSSMQRDGDVPLWPHQRRVVEETAAAWPSGRLLCDEVGMGKTVEAILVLRRLLAGRGVRRVLILLPAGLLKQWQAEVVRKGGMIFLRLESTNLLVWPDGKRQLDRRVGRSTSTECAVA